MVNIIDKTTAFMPNQEKQLTKHWDLEKCINSHSKSWFTYDGPTKLVFLPEKTSFNSNFYIKNVLPVAVWSWLVKILFINKIVQLTTRTDEKNRRSSKWNTFDIFWSRVYAVEKNQGGLIINKHF